MKDYPNHEKRYEVCYLLGKTLFHKKKLRESNILFTKILNENKTFEYTDYTLYWLAEIEIRLGNREEARKLLSLIIKRFPNFERIDYTYYLSGLLDFESNRLSQAKFLSGKFLSHQKITSSSKLLFFGWVFYHSSREITKGPSVI